jgi:pimeloyl-ACP methyl ester carboxylesterase
VALYVALRHPDVVRSLLVSGAPFGVIPTPLRWLSTGMLWLYGRSWGARVLATMMGMPDAESREAFVHTAVQTHPDTLHTVMAEIHQTPLPSGLEQIATPTLAVVGTKDTKPALQAVHYFAETIPQVVACTVPGVGHMWNAEQPELFTEMVAAWVGGYGVIDALERVTVPMVGNR